MQHPAKVAKTTQKQPAKIGDVETKTPEGVKILVVKKDNSDVETLRNILNLSLVLSISRL